MTIVEGHRTKVRAGENSYFIEVTVLPGGDRPDRLMVCVTGEGTQGDLVAEGQLEVASADATTLGSVLSETLRHHVAISAQGGRRARARPARQGRPWTPDDDAELEVRWRKSEPIEEIAVYFERSPGGIRARLPRVGCDPEQPGEYLPHPPSWRVPEVAREEREDTPGHHD